MISVIVEDRCIIISFCLLHDCVPAPNSTGTRFPRQIQNRFSHQYSS